MEEEKRELRKLIKEDNVEEFERILSSNNLLQNEFNTLRILPNLFEYEQPLLLLAVKDRSQKILEYFLSQDFVDKTIFNEQGENIYQVVCGIRGAEELFSMIERKVPHNLIFINSRFGMNAFHIACKRNNVFIVKRVYEILESLQLDLTHIKNFAMRFAIKNKDLEVIKYILSIDGIQLKDAELFTSIKFLTIDIVVYLLNVYLRQSIPSHLHNQFHIFHFSNHPPNYINNSHDNINPNLNNNKINEDEDRNNNNEDGNDYEYYLKLVEDNFNKIMNIKLYGNRIWHAVCCNENVDVVQLIYSLKGIQPDLLNDNGYNAFLIACEQNSNIKVIKYLHKLFTSFIHSQIESIQTADSCVLDNYCMKKSDKLKTLHYLYLNGIDFHFLSHNSEFGTYDENGEYDNNDIDQYLKLISHDFDYLQYEHDEEAYRKPSFWKEIDHNLADEQSIRVNEWKNRYEEHVLRHLSKMIQEHMFKPNMFL